MPSEVTKIIELNKYQKSDKGPFIIYTDLECLLQKTDGCKNNPENMLVTIVEKHIPSGFSMPIKSSFKSTEIKHDVHRGKD